MGVHGLLIAVAISPATELSGTEGLLCFLFDYSWGYFPVAGLLALVKCLMKSAFRVDPGSIFTNDNNPYSRSTAFVLMATNNSYTLGYGNLLEYECVWSGDEAQPESSKQESYLGAPIYIRTLGCVMTLAMCTALFLSHNGRWLKQIFLEMWPHHHLPQATGDESCIVTNRTGPAVFP